MTYHLLVVLLRYVLFAPLKYRWGRQSKFRWYDMILWLTAVMYRYYR